MGSSTLKLEVVLTLWVLSLLLLPGTASAFATEETGTTRYYQFDIRMTKVTRLCATKSIVTVNDQFPGPAIVAQEGDRIVVKVINRVKNNVTLHWHGVRQLRSAWADGPAYITQCPIQTGQRYVYNFTVAGQRGTLWWHAHASWLRSTLYGPIIVLPKLGVPYPFAKPYEEVPIIFGEWWKAEPEAVIAEALKSGAGPNVSDAYTINGLPGFSYDCSAQDTFQLKVKPGRTYLLRFINAALNDELFFSIAGHKLTVVEADAVYTKPFTTDTLHITPGQTANALLRTMPQFPNTTFVMGARAFTLGPSNSFDNSTVFGIVEYQSSDSKAASNKKLPLMRPSLPAFRDTPFVLKLAKRYRSIADDQFPANVPQTVDRRFLFTVDIGTAKCPRNQTCLGPNGDMFAAGLNNVSFEMPTTAFLQAHFTGQSEGVYTTDFPSNPTHAFDYTGIRLNNTLLSSGTKVVVLPYNTRVELVLQDTSILTLESHPLHLHGFNFFIVGMGIGNYDPRRDPTRFNLVDPMERNTAWVPAGGWVALRFVADNPGVWFMHCHLEAHTSWGLKTAWVVLDGELPSQKLPPPPTDLPQC